MAHRSFLVLALSASSSDNPAMRALRIAIATDSFKGTLTAPQAANCIAGGLRRALPDLATTLIPISDGGEGMTDAVLAARLGGKAENARELCYRLYTLCERKKRASEALSYNALVQSWPEITWLSREGEKPADDQGALF